MAQARTVQEEIRPSPWHGRPGGAAHGPTYLLPLLHHAQTELPYKRRKGQPLGEDEKEYNRALSRIRVKVENVIGRLKVFRVLGERYRNKRRRYGINVNIIAGIVDLMMGC